MTRRLLRASLALDVDHARLRLGPFADRDREHAVLEGRRDALGVGVGGEREGAAESAVAALDEAPLLLLLLALAALLTADGENVVLELDGDVLSLRARQLGRHDVVGVVLADVDAGSDAPAGGAPPDVLQHA